jgi:hypothetical protein
MNEAHVPSLGRYFNMSPAFTAGGSKVSTPSPYPSPYCHALSASPRDLVQLHGTFRLLLNESPEPGDRKRTAEMIRRFWKQLVEGIDLDVQPAVDKVVEWFPTSDGYEIITNFTGFDDALQTGPSRRLLLGPSHSITFRRAEAPAVYLRGQSAGTEETSANILLSEAARAVVNFARSHLINIWPASETMLAESIESHKWRENAAGSACLSQSNLLLPYL